MQVLYLASISFSVFFIFSLDINRTLALRAFHCKDSQTVLGMVNVKPTDFPNGFWIKAGEYSGDYES